MTNEKQKRQLPHEYLNMFQASSIETLKQTGEPWEHYIWINDRNLLAETVKLGEDRGFIIKDIDSLNWSRDEYLVYQHFVRNG